MTDRRTFLQLAALGFSDLLIGGPISCSAPAQAIKPSTHYGPKGKVIFALNLNKTNESTLRIFDWDDGTFQDVLAPIGIIHSIVQDPHDPNVVYLFELLGSAVRLDLKSNAFVKLDHNDTHVMFNGHGSLSRSGEFIAATEIDSAGQSTVNFRSSQTLAKVRTAPKECGNSHQVASLPGSSLMVSGVMRGYDGKTETGAITFFDGETGQIANRIEFPQPVLHVLPLSSTEVVGVSFVSSFNHEMKPQVSSSKSSNENIKAMNEKMTFQPGPLFYASLDGKKKTFWNEKEKRLFTYNFGLAKLSPTRFLSGHHDSGKVIVWEDFQMKKVIDVPQVKNLIVSRDGSEFIALSASKAVAYSLASFERKSTLDGWPDVMSFSSYS